MFEFLTETIKTIPLFWRGFIVGVIFMKAFYYLYDIYRGIKLYYEMKNWFN